MIKLLRKMGKVSRQGRSALPTGFSTLAWSNVGLLAGQMTDQAEPSAEAMKQGGLGPRPMWHPLLPAF